VDTSYIVTAERWAGCVVKDTVAVTVKPISIFNLGRDTSLCNEDSLVLTVPAAFSEYAWNIGSSSPAITVKTAGTYSVVAKAANQCYATDTLMVEEIFALPVVNLGDDFNLCLKKQKLLDAGAFKNYNWQDASSDRYASVSNKGIYWVEVRDNNGCAATDTIEIKSVLPPPSNFLPSVDSICQYDNLQLQAQRNYVAYVWSTGATQQNLTIDKSGTFVLSVTDENGCQGSDTIKVVQKDCMYGIYIPSAFTPNNDGKNDLFRAKIFGDVISYQMVLYNRFGQIVFSTRDRFSGWDGSLAGVPPNSGSYIYQVSYQLKGSEPTLEKGTVVLIR
jgi:gliding motility-associated-like protein